MLSRLLTSPGDGVTRLCHELRVASNKEVVSSLMGIMETDRECAQELHGQALEILRELAFNDPFKKQEFNSFSRPFYASSLRKRRSLTTL